uniref:Uncharacterized protein n=1 Tax=Siphoviridae sp. ct0Xn2 TaxID=2826267 RepID=A0A8S5MU91_9CAUD|nr:MAG TPA: hypothetical protein [Siphoviridae sp. ct0Xn2]DAY40954.1 MAG TPA: hypothetical protein [Bacteriophage sp.]
MLRKSSVCKKIIKLSQTAKYQMYQYQNGFLTNS